MSGSRVARLEVPVLTPLEDTAPDSSGKVRDNQRLVRPPGIREIDALPAEAAAAEAECLRIGRRMASSRRVSVVSGVVNSGQERGHGRVEGNDHLRHADR